MTDVDILDDDYLFDTGSANCLETIRVSIGLGTTRGSTIFIDGKPRFKSPQVIVCPRCGEVLRPGKATIIFKHAPDATHEQEVEGLICKCGEQYIPGIAARAAHSRAMQGSPERHNPDSSARHRNGYTWGWDALHVREAHQQGFVGTGTTVGLIDTGVDANHEDLLRKVADFAVAMPSGHVQRCDSSDARGHGTSQAGVVVGGRQSGVQIGGAPGASLRVANICDAEGHATASSLLAALDWLIERSVDILLLSVGFDVGGSAGRRRLFEPVFDRVRNLGITCIAPVGNEPGKCLAPACFRSVVACGAIAPDGDVWAHSGDQPDFVLPGKQVYSCVPSGLPYFSGQNYAWMSGTSMAAAHMAALYSIAMEAVPEVSVAELTDAFVNTASNGEWSETSGWGIPNVNAAIDFLRKRHAARIEPRRRGISRFTLPIQEFADIPLIPIPDDVEPVPF